MKGREQRVRCSWLNQGGTTELLKPPSLGVGMEVFLFEIAENAFPLRSRSRASLRRTLRVRLSRLASCGLAGKAF